MAVQGIEGIGDKTLVQVCLMVRDVEKTAANYVKIFGFDTPKEYHFTHLYDHTLAEYYGKPTDARAKIITFPMGNVVLELLQPLDPPSVWMDHLEQHGESIHHVAFRVPRTGLVVASFADHGYKVTQQGLFTERRGEYTYLDTDKDLGIVIELLERYQETAPPTITPVPADRGIGTDVVVQVGLIVEDIERSVQRYREVLGLPEARRVEVPGYDVTETTYQGQATEATARLAFFDFGQMQIELIQPDKNPSVWREFLDTKGEGGQHIAFRIKDTKKVTDHFAAQGIEIAQQGLFGSRDGMYTYMASDDKLGVTVELLERFAEPV